MTDARTVQSGVSLDTATTAPPIPTGPIVGGVRGRPFGGPLLDLGRYGYREEEYFLEGTATRYRPAPTARTWRS